MRGSSLVLSALVSAAPAVGSAAPAHAPALRSAPEAVHLACDPALAGPSASTTYTLGGWKVTVNTGTGAWSVTPQGGGAPVLSAPPTCVAEGTEVKPALRLATGEPFSVRGFGAWRVSMAGDRSDLAWEEVSGAAPQVSSAAGRLTLSWSLAARELGSAILTFTLVGGRDLQVQLSSDGVFEAGEIALTCADGEEFFGLGTQVVGMGLRGRTYPLWTQEQGIGKLPHAPLWPVNNIPEAAYAPMGVLHSTGGFSAVFTEEGLQEVDLCEAGPRWHLRAYPTLPGLVLAAGATPKDRMASVTDHVGRLSDPPDWVFAPWNDAVGGPERLYEVAGILRDRGIPSSAIWSEDWIGDSETPFGFGLSYAWEWDPTVYPDLPGDVSWLHDQGFAFLAYFNPFVPNTTRMWDEGQAGGYLVQNQAGRTYVFADPFFRPSGLVDFSNPEALAWLQGYLRTAAEDIGIDGWMADFAEWLPEDAVLFSGETGWETHNRYPLDWQRANREVMEEVHATGDEASNNWIYFSRSGFASMNGGTGGIAPTMWGGDQNTSWHPNDGLPSVLPIGIHVGLSGVALYGSDVGGYTNALSPPTTKELFYRWSEVGAFSPIMRTHHGLTECDNWSFDRDEETLLHFRRYANVHAALLPYLRARAAEAELDGWPVMRHPWLVEPAVPGLWSGVDYQYFLGDDLLVAPVLEEGGLSRDVALPAAGWWPLFGQRPETSGAVGESGAWVLRVGAAVGEIPVYVRPGAVLPLLGADVDSFYGAADPGVTDLGDVADFFRLGLYPDAEGSLGPRAFDGITVLGAGFTAPTVDWTAAWVDGRPVPLCASATPTATCALPDGGGLHVFGDVFEVTVGRATLELSANRRIHAFLAVGGAIWGAWAAPTPVTDLDPEVPLPCEQ